MIQPCFHRAAGSCKGDSGGPLYEEVRNTVFFLILTIWWHSYIASFDSKLNSRDNILLLKILNFKFAR